MAFAQTSSPPDLTQASLEDLMNIKVTSVSKKEQPLAKTGAAVFVITQEDIRRSGLTNIPDLLRLVPGADVARVDANSWAISLRGFTDVYANKVLVLIDGRSLYDPLFSGVFWDVQDVPLEDIERIEVIRGPGGTVWGANAVNGVINIITKSSKNTQGALITAGSGSQTTAGGLVRYGGTAGPHGTYSVYGKYFNIDSSHFPNDKKAADGWHGFHAGFRSDWDLSPRDLLTVQGGFYKTEEGQTFTTVFSNALPAQGTLIDRTETGGADLLGRWQHVLKNGSEMSLQVYEDNNRRRNEGGRLSENTMDLDFEHHVYLRSRHDIVWGLGARVMDLSTRRGYGVSFSPDRWRDLLLSTFVQDEIRLANSLWLTVGSKFEHNDYTGFEYEPGAQLVWTPKARHSLWFSAARAIRQPSSVETAIADDLGIIPAADGSFALLKLLGNPQPQVEKLNDFEAGYRAPIGARVSVDVTAFRSYYRDLQTVNPQTPYFATDQGPPHLVLPFTFRNLARMQSYGGELSLNWDVSKRWRISPGYANLHSNVMQDPSSLHSQIILTPGAMPAHQIQIRSLFDLPHHLEWDSNIAYISPRAGIGIPSYFRLDTRVGWRFAERTEFSITGQNLLRAHHEEIPDELGITHTLVERTVFGKITLRF